MKGIGDILNKLQKVKSLSNGEFQACCPVHDDRQASLSLKQTNDKILLDCKAGCQTQDILTKLSLTMADLFIDQKPLSATNIAKTYDYKDESGDLLFQVCRLEPKSFRQRHKDAGGEWLWNMEGVRKVIYHLPEVLEVIPPDVVYIVEGEKDADNLMDRGMIATTSPGGAGNWKPEYAQYFKGKVVCIIPDKDSPGFKYAALVAQSLKGVAREIYEILLPGETVKDVSDWLEQGGAAQDLPSMAHPYMKADITDNTDNTPLLLTNLTNTDMSVMDTRGKILWPLVDQWLTEHKGEKFDLDTICRHLGVVDRDGRHTVVQKLSYEVKAGNLEKSDRLYSYIDKTFTLIDWVNASPLSTIDLRFPYGVNDKTTFDFAEYVTTSPGDVIVIAGVSNTGKSAFCLNLLWNNMDYYPCTLMGNEYQPSKFKRRVESMTWANPLKENGIPKFELIERHDNWKSIIRPDTINIIDWINLPDNFYQIGTIIEGIQSKLHNGIAVISLQKSEGKSLGLGGGFSQHLASLYLAIDFEKLTVVKAKEWRAPNPNGKSYAFQITDANIFGNIREVRKCNRCGGSGQFKGSECDKCDGKGVIDVQ